MADFLTNLWNGVFEAGPTPTLLIATNASFAALQVLLIALLIATYSIHFIILSILCAVLWYSINWFAVELRAAQVKEEEAERLRKGKHHTGRFQDKDDVGEVADDEVDDTEVEGDTPAIVEKTTTGLQPSEALDKGHNMRDHASTAQAAFTPTSSQSDHDSGQMHQRNWRRSADASGELSTDSEWEKVDDER